MSIPAKALEPQHGAGINFGRNLHFYGFGRISGLDLDIFFSTIIEFFHQQVDLGLNVFTPRRATLTLRPSGTAAKEVLPEDFSYSWSGEAFYQKKAGGTSGLVFVFGLIMVFLILAAQYEKWSLPFGVLMAVPFALFGALLSILMRGIENDVYFQIGLLTLIALAAKNGILITEFAVMKRAEGMSVYDAALEAARLRLRPIVMTSIAFILGCVPLAIASGASANSRHSIGTGVVGGMLGATVIAIFFIPMFYQFFENLGARSDKKKKGEGPSVAVGGEPVHESLPGKEGN